MLKKAPLVKLNEYKADTAHYYLSEREFNMHGLSMFYGGYQGPGLEALRLNSLLYPTSANVYDSYAGALRDKGKKQEAIIMYRKSLQLNPSNEAGQRALGELEQGDK